jgi:D-sedoheptulose 7-phosphate isomerase
VNVLALTGEPGEPLGALADVWVKVPAQEVARVQELHMAIYHALCAALEEEFFG